MGQPVVHFEVLGKDGEQLRSFYSDLFGWQIEVNGLDYGTIQREGNTGADGAGIGGGIGSAPGDYAGHVTFYVQVPDVESALAAAEELGGTRLMGPAEVPGVGIVLGQFADPEGNLIGVMNGG